MGHLCFDKQFTIPSDLGQLVLTIAPTREETVYEIVLSNKN